MEEKEPVPTQPDIKTPRYPLESQTPILGLSKMNPAEIVAEVQAQFNDQGWFSFEHTEQRSVAEFEEPRAERDPAILIRGNQWRWELGDLSFLDPRKAMELVNEFKAAGDGEMAAFLVSGIIADDPEKGWDLATEMLSDYYATWDTALSLSDAIESGRIKGKLAGDLFRHMGSQIHDHARSSRNIELDNSTLRHVNEDLGSAAQRAATFHVVNPISTAIGPNSRIFNILDTGKDKSHE
ncbi:hypothetical protein [Nocardia abscessus]|uniref:hypothetical protein n=1 Tax=Nocardia abscessus TaxID=120957 RepID=UPI002458073E|nr:hypothetical protein [Nocardia abscessus]